MNEIVKCMNEVIFCFDYTNMQDYDKLHYTKINASEVCPKNVIIRGLLCLNIVQPLPNIGYISVMSLFVCLRILSGYRLS